MLNILQFLGQTDSAAGEAAAGLFAGGMFMFALIIAIGMYVVFAIALMTIAKKTGTPDEWWAWVPILNLLLMAKMAGHEWWMGLLCLLPYVGFAVLIYLWWKIAEKRGKPGWISLGLLVPCVQFAVPLYLAFAD